VSDGLVLRLQFPPEVTLEDIEFSKAMKTSSGAYADEISEVADRALASFVVIQAMLKKSLKVRKYADNAALKNRIPGFNVSLFSNVDYLPSKNGRVASKSCQ
jgi:hypothetical protein